MGYFVERANFWEGGLRILLARENGFACSKASTTKGTKVHEGTQQNREVSRPGREICCSLEAVRSTGECAAVSREIQMVNRLAAFIFAILFCLVALGSGFAQQRSSAHQPAKSTSHEKLPRSVPSSGLPDATGTRSAARRQELQRLEHSTVSHAKTPTPRQPATHGSASALTKSQGRNRPTNFSYQGPRNSQPGHHSTVPRAH